MSTRRAASRRPTSTSHRVLLAAGVIAALATVPLALVIAPADALQGEAQRWMYLHVPAAWSAFLCFGVVLVASVRHAVSGGNRPHVLGRAAAEAGVVLTALTLLTGSIWGSQTWGTGWAWDARIISTVAMGLVYVVYLSAMGLVSDRRGRLLVDAIGIFGFLTVPLVHFSVLWWRTLHQPPTILAPSLDPPIEPLMGLALAAAVLTFTLLTAWAVSCRSAALRSKEAERRAGAQTAASSADARPDAGGAGSGQHRAVRSGAGAPAAAPEGSDRDGAGHSGSGRSDVGRSGSAMPTNLVRR